MVEDARFDFSEVLTDCTGGSVDFAMTEAQLVLATLAREWALDRQYDDLTVSAAVTLQPKGDVAMVL